MLPILNNRISNNTLLAVDIESAARQCRLTSDDLKDVDVLETLSNAMYSAQAYLESNYSVVFGKNTFLGIWKADKSKLFHFSIANVTEVKSVTLSENPLSPVYNFYKSNTHAYIELASTVSDIVKVEYTAGFETTESVPQAVKQAVLMLTSYYFDNRTDTGNTSHKAIDALMLPYKKLF